MLRRVEFGHGNRVGRDPDNGVPKFNSPTRRQAPSTHEGLVAGRQGVGTFVTRTLTDESLASHVPLRRDLRVWLRKARAAGLDDDSIEALFADTLRDRVEGVA